MPLVIGRSTHLTRGDGLYAQSDIDLRCPQVRAPNSALRIEAHDDTVANPPFPDPMSMSLGTAL